MPVGQLGAAECDGAEAALMARVAAGDHGAMEAIYDRYSRLVYAIAMRMLHDAQAAEELLSDIFMELWRKVERFDAARGSLATYLATLTRSRAIDRMRAARRHAAAPLAADQAAALVDPAAAPSSRLTGAEDRARMVTALGRLSGDQRSTLELAYFDDLSHSEIATRLGKPLGTVKTHIRQGLIMLREILQIRPGDGAGSQS
jgi:RNA polymerase sigma-70 factor (ECF subfamily)